MLDQIFGGAQMIMGGFPPSPAKMGLIFLLLTIFTLISLFSWKPLFGYPGYATDKTYAPAYWTGFSLGLNLLMIMVAGWKLT